MNDADWLQFGLWVASTLLLLGVQWGTHRSEIKHLQKDLDARLGLHERKLAELSTKIDARLEESQKAQSEYLEARFAALEARLTKMDQDRMREFDRLHAKADKALADIALNWQQAHRDFVTRLEFDQLTTNHRTLEARVNTYLETIRKVNP